MKLLKTKKIQLPYLTKLIRKLAPKLGARVVVEPEWGIVSQIIYKNGVVRSLRMYSLDLNHIASSDIAKDKDYAKFFMKKRGYPVAPGFTILKDNWAKNIKSKKNTSFGINCAEKTGYPLIVKPNSGSKGVDVSVTRNRKELVSALHKIFKGDRVAIVEKYLPGHDHRIVVLDKEIISAYERIALSVTGDGKRSIFALLKEKQKVFISKGRDTKINFKDKRIKDKLIKQGFSFKSIPKKDEKVFLLDNANLSTGGDSYDVTNTIHSGFKKIAVNLTRDMGLRISGVDIMVTKGNITMSPKDCEYYIIEINSAPGLDHYVTTGEKQRKIVEAMYLKVFKALGKKD
jgi:D-alanine-D-alanine ligase-like ATP-grasp enzyme